MGTCSRAVMSLVGAAVAGAAVHGSAANGFPVRVERFPLVRRIPFGVFFSLRHITQIDS